MNKNIGLEASNKKHIMNHCVFFIRNVCLWDTLISPGNSLIHGELRSVIFNTL